MEQHVFAAMLAKQDDLRSADVCVHHVPNWCPALGGTAAWCVALARTQLDTPFTSCTECLVVLQ
jgi:hypothetical protein